MSKERLNYKECRENVFKLIEKSNILSKQEIWYIIGLGDSMDYICDYWSFSAFLNYTRRYAHREYWKSKKEQIFTSNIIFLRNILNKDKYSIPEFIRFCEIERIPLLYYVPQIKKYIFPNELLLKPIYNRLYIITVKGFITSLKRAEIFGVYKNVNEVIVFLSQKFKEDGIKKDDITNQYLFAFLRKNYIFGENKEQMFERLNYKEDLKQANKEIKKNLYSIINLEIYNEEGSEKNE